MEVFWGTVSAFPLPSIFLKSFRYRQPNPMKFMWRFSTVEQNIKKVYGIGRLRLSLDNVVQWI